MARPRPSRPLARRHRAPASRRYGAPGTAVRFEDAIDVADHLHRTLRGWAVAPADAAEAAAVTVTGGLDGFTVRSPWLDADYRPHQRRGGLMRGRGPRRVPA